MRLLLPYELLQNYPESTINDVLDHTSNLWKVLDLNTEDNYEISWIILYNAIQNYNNLCGAKEEQYMIPQELSRLLVYWKENFLIYTGCTLPRQKYSSLSKTVI